MNAILQKIEEILTNPFSNENYLVLVKEIFDNVSTVNPYGFNKEYTNFSTHIEGSTHVCNYETPDGKTVTIFAVKLKALTYVANSRSKQRSYAKKIIENANSDAALVAFYTENDPKWRLSFVRLDYELKIENGKLKASESLTPAKRYSYLVGEGEPCHTAIDRLNTFIINHDYHPTLDEIEEAFSIEKVTQEFFQLYCEKFHQLREHLENSEDFVIEAQQHNFTSAQFAKKLMGQIVFLYFLQKKGWLGVSAWPRKLTEKQYKDAFFARGAKSRELIPLVYKQLQDGAYGLNGRGLEQISDEDEEILASCVRGEPWGTGPHNFMRRLYDVAIKVKASFYNDYLEPLFYEALNVSRGEQGYCPALHCRIPFLSGGLFEPIDGYEWKHNNFDLPNEIFSNRINDNPRTGDGILDIFDRYSFTISEDEPMEREVAIDPEMLGKVFENLLEVNDRKSKGAFYTPREIVHYMCRESLINYLAGAMKLDDSIIRDFILYGDLMKDEDTVKAKREGNGGMYISEELFKVENDGTVSMNRLAEMDQALKDVRIADPAVGSGAFPLGMLNEIVRARQNITEYLIVYEKSKVKQSQESYVSKVLHQDRSAYNLKYETMKNCIYAVDIEPSAVDIAQLRLWLSLVIDDEINPDANNPLDGHRNPLPLPNLECNILCGNSLIDEFKGLKLINRSDFIGTAVAGAQFDFNTSIFDSTVAKLIEAQDELFRCDNTQKKKELLDMIAAIRDTIILQQMTGASAETLSEYEETKNMVSKPYVLWQLDFARVFKEKGGFDIVIGNPPYGAKFTTPEKQLLKKIYSESNVPDYESADFFIEKGKILLRDRGILSFIIPNTFMVNLNAKRYREHLLNSWGIYQIDNLSDIDVFESATVRNCIVFFYARADFDYPRLTKLTIQNNKLKTLSNKVFSYNALNDSIDNWLNLLDKNNITLSIIKKMEDGSTKLYDIADISQGLIPYDKYRGHSEETIKNKIWNADYQKDNTYKKELRGKDISRYTLKWNGKDWLSYGDWLAAPRKKEFFTDQRILIREITNPRILATVTCEEYYNTPSIINCINFKEDIYYVLGLINSTIMSFYHNMTSPKASKGLFPKILVNDVRNLPICNNNSQIVNRISALAYSLLNGEGNNVTIDAEIDTLVYQLYELSTSEIDFVVNWVTEKEKI